MEKELHIKLGKSLRIKPEIKRALETMIDGKLQILGLNNEGNIRRLKRDIYDLTMKINKQEITNEFMLKTIHEIETKIATREYRQRKYKDGKLLQQNNSASKQKD